MNPVNASSMIACDSRAAAAELTAQKIADALSEDVAANGAASLLVSGGSTPKDMYRELSELDLPWEHVSIGLVDERSVPAEHAASNAGLVHTHLLKNRAAAARFVPMFQDIDSANSDYARLVPASMLLLGMGADGHTASWFPGASNLEDALGKSSRTVVAIDANGCSGAGEVTSRLTLTRAAVAASRHAVLMIFGDDKKDVLANALTAPIEEAPIRAAVDDLGDRLVTVWAP